MSSAEQMFRELGYEPNDEMDGLAAHFVRKNPDAWVDDIMITDGMVFFDSGGSAAPATVREIRAVAALLDELEEKGALQE